MNKKCEYLCCLLILYLCVGVINRYEKTELQEKAFPVSAGEEAVPQTETISNETKKVALTFDDGPGDSTERLLQGLKERNVRATFFVVGEQVEKYPEVVKKMQEDGHLIGNHTYRHVQLNTMKEEEAIQEVEKNNSLLKEITGQEILFLRPPFGECSKCLKNDLNMMVVLWDVDPLDWAVLNTDIVVRRVVENVAEDDIILLHDIYETSVDAALQIVDILQNEKYEFVTVEELLLP